MKQQTQGSTLKQAPGLHRVPPPSRDAMTGVQAVTPIASLHQLDAHWDVKPAHARMRTYAVSRVQLDPDGRIIAVLWGPVDTARNAWAQPELVAPVAAVVEALRSGDQVFALFPSTHGHMPERRFVVADYDGSRDTIVLFGPAAPDREVHDMDHLDRYAAV
jgi:hypothetical protein